jgi:hypothetical protein
MKAIIPKDKTLIGKSKELYVAWLLINEGFYVYWPFVDRGFDLVVTNGEGKKFIPIQIKFREKDNSLGLHSEDVNRFAGKNVYLAFIAGQQPRQKIWLLPFREWEKISIDRNRRDHKIYVNIAKNEDILKTFEGINGLSFLRHELESQEQNTSTQTN